jgi:hypothetical protein
MPENGDQDDDPTKIQVQDKRVQYSLGPNNKHHSVLHATRSCNNIFCGYLYVSDLTFVFLKGIYGFKFPERFLEISSRDLTSFLLQLI